MSLKENSELILLLTNVWFMLLGLCGIIGGFVVTIDLARSYIENLGIGAMKVMVSFLVLGFWLIIWYTLMRLTLVSNLSELKADNS